MDFVPPPYPDDVDFDTGPYNRDEIIVARASLLHSLQRETSQAWQGIKYKLGILPTGHRLRTFEPQQVWLPPCLPELWSAPVVLHDPTAPEDDDDWNPGRAEKDRKRGGEEELSTSSNARVTGTESRLSYDYDGRYTTSTRPSGKRSWESLHGTGDQTPSTSGKARDDDVVSRKKLKKLEKKKKRKVGMPESSMLVSSLRDDAAGEGSSKCVKTNSDCEGDAEEEEEQYKMVFQCDVCSLLSQDSGKMRIHLSQKSHCSASRYVAEKEAGRGGGELRLVYLSVASMLNKPQHAFKEKVVACPQCHIIFANLSQCLKHSLQVHKEPDGQYCLRDVTKTEAFKLEKDESVCPDCGERFQDKELQAHIKKTQHMALYLGKRTSEATMIFLCPFCNVPYMNYVSYKSHVFSSKHAEDGAYWGTLTATCCMLGESGPPRTMLPQDPGVVPAAPQTLSKAKRIKRRLEKLKQRQGLLPRKKEKPKKKTHKERLAAFKAKVKRKLR